MISMSGEPVTCDGTIWQHQVALVDNAELCERLVYVARILKAEGYDGHAMTVADAIAALMGAR